jgi:peptidoglycan hydrolase-like protein with peptidoglycan-binding domain
MAYTYTNAQFRSILNGLGFRKRGLSEPQFPVSSDNSSLGDTATVQAIIDFQRYFNLAPDGIVGPLTMAKAEKQMHVIHYELDLIMQPNPPLRPQPPLYGSQTSAAVRDFRRRYGFEPDGNPNNDFVADIAVRRKLDQLTPGLASSESELDSITSESATV